jgi:murein DD-endopeptidase MepM/ murein hydrolase activator NlpD
MKLLISSISYFILFFFPFSSFSWALEFRLPERVFQGDMVVGKVEPVAAVFLKGKELPVSEEGYFVIGVPRLQKTDLLITAGDGKRRVSRTVKVLAYKWKIQRISGLQERYVSPPPDALAQIKIDSRRVREVRRAKIYPIPLFMENGFIVPVEGRVSGVFGSQRILNGKPRSPHSGLDIAAPKGTPVVSPAGGIVRLAATGMYLMGNTLMIDHGLGVISIFIHLDSISARVGESVGQGEIVARIGQTGRATGPHLHWGISVGSISIDPARLLNKTSFLP